LVFYLIAQEKVGARDFIRERSGHKTGMKHTQNKLKIVYIPQYSWMIPKIKALGSTLSQ